MEDEDEDENSPDNEEETSSSASYAIDDYPEASSFQARLLQIRQRSKTTDEFRAHSDECSDVDSDDLVDRIKALLMEGKVEHIGDTDSDAKGDLPAKRSNKIPSHLKSLWERDRTKKAEQKRARRLARIQEDSLTAKERKKLRKRNKYDLLQAGLADPDNGLLSIDSSLVDLELVVRDFVRDLDGRDALVLPPMDKQTRASIHQLASAFNLKSKSQGKGDGRFTTLFRTSKTGIGIKEWKVEKIIYGTSRRRFSRQKEGDEVGKSAPKVGESNIGFKLLQQMGWKEGDSIGISGGLEAPIVAIFKRTKLGLGATNI